MKLVKTLTDVSYDSLVFDSELYPRSDVDTMHVRSLVEAMQSGADLPAVVVEAKTLRVTDGWHRSRAYHRLGKPIPKVQCWHYDNDTEALRHAVELNSGHGLRLTETDRRRIASILSQQNVPVDEIAVVLHVPPPKVVKLISQVAVTGGGEHVALKNSVRSLAGTVLTDGQREAIRTAPGTNYALLARQLAEALENRLLPEEDERLEELLRRLRVLLDRRFGRMDR